MLNKRLIVGILTVVLLFLGIFSFAQGRNNNETTRDASIPVITLKGDKEVTIEVGSQYEDAGATATDEEDGDLTEEIVINNPVDTSVVANYTITYDVTDSDDNDAVQVTRTVKVVDTTIPVITMIGGNVTIKVGGNFVDPGATATDNYDENITANIVATGNVNPNVIGTYTVTYNVTDANGNAAVPVQRMVFVVDDELPLISLNGDAEVTIEVGDTYVDAGAVAVDNYDGDLVVTAVSNVDEDTAGIYEIVYSATDTSGNEVSTKRTVIVKPKIVLSSLEEYDFDDEDETGKTLIVKQGSAFTIPSAKAILGVENTDDNVTIEGNINTNLIDTYQLVYRYTLTTANGTIAANNVTLTIKVADLTAPTLRLHVNGKFYDGDGHIFNTKEIAAVITDTNIGKFYIDGKEYPQYEDKDWFGLGWTLTEGEHTFKAVDDYGNYSELSFEIDLTKPVVRVLEKGKEVASGSYVDRTGQVQINAVDKNIGKVYINGKEYPQYEGKDWYDIDWILRGSTVETNKIVLEDKAGNKSDEFIVMIDLTDPTLRLHVNGKFYDGDGHIFNTKEIAAVIADANIGKFYINGVEYPQYEGKDWFGLGWTLAEGEYTFKAVDKYGNYSELSFEIDLTKPVVRVLEKGKEVASGSYVDRTGQVQINAVDKNIGKVYINGVEYPQYEGEDWYDIDWILRGSTVETNKIVLEDKAGNKSDEFIVMIDLTDPTLRLFVNGKFYDGDGHIFNTKEIAAVIADANIGKFYINGVEYPQYEGKDWFGLGWTLAEGEYTFKSVDKYGNYSELSFEIDLTVPTGEVVLSTTEFTNGNVIATLTTSEVVKDIAGWTRVPGTDNQFTKAYTQNTAGTVTVSFVDMADNPGSASFVISNIDKDDPVITVNPTTVTVNRNGTYNNMSGVSASDVGVSGLSGPITSNYNSDWLKTVGTYTITYSVSDNAGNTGTASRTLEVIALPEQYTFNATDEDENYSGTQGNITVTVSKERDDKRTLRITALNGVKIGKIEKKSNNGNYSDFNSFNGYKYKEYTGTMPYTIIFDEDDYGDKITVYLKDQYNNEYLIKIEMD